MPQAKKIINQEENHTHVWGPGYDLSERKCSCGKILVSQIEMERRIEEWENYYKICRHSESYNQFRWIQALYKKHNFKRMREVLEKVKQRVEHIEDDWIIKCEYLPKPSCPDPNGNMYITI